MAGVDETAGTSLGIEVTVGADADAQELAAATAQLRREILELDVEGVEPRPAGAPPPGVRAVDVIALGSLIVTIVNSDAFAAVVKAVLAWLGRRHEHGATLEVHGDVLAVTGSSSREQARRCQEWLGRRTPGGHTEGTEQVESAALASDLVQLGGSRHALIIANDAYEDPGLRQLRAPAHDAVALARVLGDPRIGGFDVLNLLNQPAHLINEAVEDFFADRHRDDLLLLHFSGHGVKDEAGELHFAAANTKLRRLGATAVAAEFVNRRMTRSRSQRIVVLLDCCYAGAFDRSLMARGGGEVGIEEHFGGRGRAVITASSAVEYAFEGDQLTDISEPTPSVFTTALVEGLATGDADRDQDGYVGLDELYDYVYDRVREATPHQTPSKWTFAVQGDLYIARRSRPVTTPAPLPSVLQEAVDHPLPRVRLGAVHELEALLGSKHAGVVLAATQTLEQLAGDDSRMVSGAAAEALAVLTPSPAPPAPPPPTAPTALAAESPAITAKPSAPAAPAAPVARSSMPTEPPVSARSPEPRPVTEEPAGQAEPLMAVRAPVTAERQAPGEPVIPPGTPGREPGWAYPTTLQVDVPEPIGHWRPLVQWLLDVPRLVVLFCLSVASLVVAVLSWLAILATGHMPAGMAGIQVLTLRYRERVYLHAKGLIAEPPRLAWAGTPVDPGDYPRVVVSVQPAAAGRNRLTTFVRWLLVFPHGITGIALATAAFFVRLIGLFPVLFDGRWPPELYGFLIMHRRWRLRVSAYARLLTDDYPPFVPD